MAGKTPPVGDVFMQVVEQVSNAAREGGHRNAVDLELTFAQVKASGGGVPLIVGTSKESNLQIRLATRLLPPED